MLCHLLMLAFYSLELAKTNDASSLNCDLHCKLRIFFFFHTGNLAEMMIKFKLVLKIICKC